MRKIDYIIIHCSATPKGKAYTATNIDLWHRQRGWHGIGYHYVITLDGTLQKGRPLQEIGAHCQGHNTHSIGICYIGGLNAQGTAPEDTRTVAQHNTLRLLVGQLLKLYPQAHVIGHREVAATACPSFDVAHWLQEVRL